MKLQCDLCREIVVADFAVAGAGIEVFCPACGKSFPVAPTRTDAPIVELARVRAARRAPAAGEPTMKCPKCDDTQPPSAACRSCGLLAARMTEFERDRDAKVAPEVQAAWSRVDEHWSDDDAHEAFLKVVVTAMAYPWAALRYRDALRLRPDDPRAASQLARLARMAEATLWSSKTSKADAKARPYRSAVALLVAMLVLMVVGLGYAMITTQRAESDAGTTPAPKLKGKTPRSAPRPRPPVDRPGPGNSDSRQ